VPDRARQAVNLRDNQGIAFARRAYNYAKIKNYLHGTAFKGRLAYAMRAGSAGRDRR
jgi:hypothetical protein